MYALITGGSRGIGRAIAIRLAADGHSVIINYNSNERDALLTQQTIEQAGGKAELLRFDVSDPVMVREAIAQWQKEHQDDYIGILVNNAGICRDSLLAFMEDEDVEKVISTNLYSFFYLTRPLLTGMVAHRWGRIVNMASLSGLKGLPGQTNYAASKGGIIAATKALAQEVAKRKITVNAVAPGFIETDMTASLNQQDLKAQIPIGRLGKPEEVAALVAFLVSDSAAYITGECININGGLYS